MSFVHLSSAAQITMGQSPPSNTYNELGDGLPFFQGKADFGYLYPKVRMYCNAPKKIAEKGDILVSVRAPVGPTNINPYKSCIGRGLASIRARNNTTPKYLLYFLRYYEPILSKSGRGSTFDAIGKEDLANISLPLPPFPEQRRIASILDKADRLRRLRRFALQLGEGYLQSVFLEMFGDPVTNPMGWEIRNLGSQINSIRYGTGSPPGKYLENGIPFIRATNIKKGTIQDTDMVFLSEDVVSEIEKCQVCEGDLLIVRSGINTGDCAIIPQKYNGAYAAYDLIIEIDYPKNIFYNLLVNSEYGKAVIRTLSRRAGQPHLNSDQVKSLSFPLPEPNLLDKFAIVVQRFNHFQSQQQEALRQEEYLFQSLLARAFDGGL